LAKAAVTSLEQNLLFVNECGATFSAASMVA
jgi:hypothetical protein